MTDKDQIRAYLLDHPYIIPALMEGEYRGKHWPSELKTRCCEMARTGELEREFIRMPNGKRYKKFFPNRNWNPDGSNKTELSPPFVSRPVADIQVQMFELPKEPVTHQYPN